MSILLRSLPLLVLSLATSSVAANELIVQRAKFQGGGLLSLDVNLSEGATALEVRIPIAQTKSVESRCSQKIPATHMIQCGFNGKEIVILLFSVTNQLLPSGLLELGSFKIAGADVDQLKVEQFLVVRPDASEMSARVVESSVEEITKPTSVR